MKLNFGSKKRGDDAKKIVVDMFQDFYPMIIIRPSWWLEMLPEKYQMKMVVLIKPDFKQVEIS